MPIPMTPSPLVQVLASKTYNVAWFGTPSNKEAAVQACINAALADGASYALVPETFRPFKANLVTFNPAIHMLCEWGDPSLFDARAYGAAADGVTDDLPSVQAAIAGANLNGVVKLPIGTVLLNNASAQALLLPRNAVGLKISGHGPETILKLSANTPRAFDFNKTTDGDTFQNIEISDMTIDAQNIGGRHSVIGTYANGSSLSRINLLRFAVKRVKITNLLRDPNTAVNHRLGVWGFVSDSVAGGTRYDVNDFVCEDVRVEGGNYGCAVGGTGITTTGLNVFIDNVRFTRCYHDTGVTPTAFFTSANFHVGSRGSTGKILIEQCQGYNSGDVGIEIDSFDQATVKDCLMQDAWNIEYFYTNFNTSATGATALANFTNCRARRVNSINGRGYQLSGNLGLALGKVTYVDCSYENSNASPFSQSNLYDGAALFVSSVTIESIELIRFKSRDKGWTFTDTNPQVKTQVTFNPTTTNCNITIRDIDLLVRGTQGGGSGNFNSKGVLVEGLCTLNVHGGVIDQDITSGSSFGQIGFDLGVATCTLSGKISRVKFVSTGVSPRGVVVRGVATLTVNPPFWIEDCDFSGMPDGGATEVLFATGSENKNNLYFRGNKWKVFPALGSNIAVGASPFSYQNLDGYKEVVTVSGGTVSAIDIAPDGSTFTVTGLTSGAFDLENSATLKVTYTVTPTMKKIPLT